MRLTKFHIRTAEAAKGIIDASVDRNVKLEQVARQLEISVNLLRKIFKHHYNVGLNTYRVHVRLERARELLSQGNGNLKSISKKSGYNSVSNFITAFKKAYGKTPGVYREL